MTASCRVWLLCCGLVVPSACAPGDTPAPVLDTIEEAQAPVAYAVTSEPFIDTRLAVPAVASPDVPAFSVLSRESQLAKAPCSRCHTEPVASMRWSGADGRRRAHWEVNLAHAPAEVMQCDTCHQVDGGGALRLLGGLPVGFDHAYQTCGQCHTGQVADWAGGAHGKRAGGWAPPRVVYNCTECHDPHRPTLASRWPARAGRQPVDGRAR